MTFVQTFFTWLSKFRFLSMFTPKRSILSVTWYLSGFVIIQFIPNHWSASRSWHWSFISNRHWLDLYPRHKFVHLQHMHWYRLLSGGRRDHSWIHWKKGSKYSFYNRQPRKKTCRLFPPENLKFRNRATPRSATSNAFNLANSNSCGTQPNALERSKDITAVSSLSSKIALQSSLKRSSVVSQL